MAKSVADILANRGVESDELSHVGVKGMKWGKRKGRSSSSSAPKEDLSKFSDDELKQKINRLKLEKEYKSLTSTPQGKSAVKSGAKAVGKMLAKVGQKEAEAFLQEQAKKAIVKAVAKHAAEKTAKVAIGALTK